MELLYAINMLLLFIDARDFARRPESILEFMKLCFTIIIGVGLVFVQIMEATVGFKFPLRGLEALEVAYLVCYFAMRIGGGLATAIAGMLIRHKTTPYGPRDVSRSTREALICLAALSLLSIGTYTVLNGLSFGQSSYESRYEDAQGNGLLLMLIPAFLPYAALCLKVAKSGRQFLKVAILTLSLSAYVYVLLDGYRQILIASVLLVVIIYCAQNSRRGPFVIFASLIGAPIVALGLAFLRYIGEASFPFESIVAAAFYYLQGDLFPVDAPIRIGWYCDLRVCPGLEVFINHFSRLVPRAIWSEKPFILQDAAGFYTRSVLGYPRTVTLSPTILGEAILLGGLGVAIPMLLLSGFVAQILTVVMQRISGVLHYILLANVYCGFFWIREGLSNGLYRVFTIIIFTMLAKLCLSLLQILRPARPRLLNN